MEKIKELLGKIGASEELAHHVCEELERYSTALKEQKNKELQEKIAKVKSICIEEVQKEKINLARKVSTFLESKAEAIERAMKRQRVVEESEATSLLKKAKSILEGIELGGEVSSRELLALQKKAERLEKAIGTLREERNRAVGKANKANEIAVKVLKRNQLYESKLKKAGLLTEAKKSKEVCSECGGPMVEGKCPKCDTKAASKKTAKESKNRLAKALSESRNRLGKGRKVPAKPKSTRRTLIESEIPGAYSQSGSPDITKIASEMPE
jgi:hypothetical protein